MNDKSVSAVSLNSCHFQETAVKANYTDSKIDQSPLPYGPSQIPGEAVTDKILVIPPHCSYQ